MNIIWIVFCSSVLVQAAAASGASGQVDPGPSPAEQCGVRERERRGGGTCQGIVSTSTSTVSLSSVSSVWDCLLLPRADRCLATVVWRGKLRLRRVTSIVNKLDTEKWNIVKLQRLELGDCKVISLLSRAIRHHYYLLTLAPLRLWQHQIQICSNYFTNAWNIFTEGLW